MARKNGAAALDDTRQLLTAANAQVEDLRRQRADELKGAADETTLDRYDTEIRKLELAASRHQERIALLEAAEKEAEAERRIKERASLIERIEKRLGERHAVALEIAEGIKMADAGLRKLIDIARSAQSAWAWESHNLAPALLAPSAIVKAIEHELYRRGARPLLLGGQDKFGAGINFPGGRAPRLELAGMPAAIKSFADVMDEAGDFASRIMRGKAANASVIATMPAEGDRKATPAQTELALLLQRQNELAADISPEGEAAYQAAVAEIARVSALVDAEKTNGELKCLTPIHTP